MTTTYRLCTAALLAASLAACGELPTTALTAEAAAPRRDGGGVAGGGYRTGDADTVPSLSASQTAGVASCGELDGGGMGGGGYFTATEPCA